jgi:carboxymethylenebutenolidase
VKINTTGLDLDDPPGDSMPRHTPTPALTLLALLLLSGCGNSEADAPAARAEDITASSEGPRIPLAPTAADALPSALLGQAGPLQGEDLRYVEGDTLTTGYLAVPEGAGPFPALVIVHEWNGLVDRVREVADDFAAEGYVTLAVDLYDGRTGSNPDENIALVREVGADQPKMIANMNAAVGYLRGRPDVTGRVGAMGWCFGGGIALSFGLDGENHEATAIFYGRLVDDPEVLSRMDHEVYGTFARLDQGPAPEQVQAFQAALEAAGIENDLHIYDDVNHGFWLHADQDPEVRNGPALDAWQRLKAYLDRTLG